MHLLMRLCEKVFPRTHAPTPRCTRATLVRSANRNSQQTGSAEPGDAMRKRSTASHYGTGKHHGLRSLPMSTNNAGNAGNAGNADRWRRRQAPSGLPQTFVPSRGYGVVATSTFPPCCHVPRPKRRGRRGSKVGPRTFLARSVPSF